MKEELYHQMRELENSYWWYVARRKIILSLVTKFFHRPEGRVRVLDIGCGTGSMLRWLATYGEVRGIDASPVAVTYAQDQAPTAEVRQVVFPKEPLPWRDRYNLITLLDVLEHLDDDLGALHHVQALLADGGMLVLTVPAFQFLWSGHDEAHHHRRRYTRRALRQKLEAAGFTVAKLSYFNSLLALPILGVRLLGKVLRRGQPASDLRRSPRSVNAVLTRVFGFERFILRFISMPVGVSIIAIVERAAPLGTATALEVARLTN